MNNKELYSEKNNVNSFRFINYKEFGLEIFATVVELYPKVFSNISVIEPFTDSDLCEIANNFICLYPKEAIEWMYCNFNNKDKYSKSTITAMCNIIKTFMVENKGYILDSSRKIFCTLNQYNNEVISKYLENSYRVGMDILSEVICSSAELLKYAGSCNLSKDSIFKAGNDFVKNFTDSANEFAMYKCFNDKKYSIECMNNMSIVVSNILGLTNDDSSNNVKNKSNSIIINPEYVIFKEFTYVNIKSEMKLNVKEIFSLENDLIARCTQVLDISDYNNPKKVELSKEDINNLEWIEINNSVSKMHYSECDIA